MRRWTVGIAAAAMAAAAMVAAPARAAPEVVASIKPVHALVAGVMAGVGEPKLLVPGGASPHAYALRPSDARALQRADVVFWVGDMLETSFARPMRSLPHDALVVTLTQAPGIRLLETRSGGIWGEHVHDHAAAADDDHDHDHEHDHDHDGIHEAAGGQHHDDHDDHDHDQAHAHDHGGDATAIDGHIWLDPANARAIVAAAVAALSERDPANADAYAANGTALVGRIDALEAELAARLAPVRDRPYLVFHDGYHYFEDRFGLRAAGAVTVSPELRPGARRLTELRAEIADRGAVCVFSEPQFEPTLVETLTTGLTVGRGVLDPLGADLEAGPDLYPQLMTALADSLVRCLGGA